MTSTNSRVPAVGEWTADQTGSKDCGGEEGGIDGMNDVAGDEKRPGRKNANVKGQDGSADEKHRDRPGDLTNQEVLPQVFSISDLFSLIERRRTYLQLADDERVYCLWVSGLRDVSTQLLIDICCERSARCSFFQISNKETNSVL